MIYTIILTPLVVFVLLTVIILLLRKPLLSYLGSFTQKVIDNSIKAAEQKSKEVFADEKEKVAYLISGNEKFMEGKKDLISVMVKNIQDEIKSSQSNLILAEKERTAAFKELTTTVEQHKNTTEALRLTTDNLRKILSNNQLRGSFGQEVAEDLLKIAGFVKGQNYTSQAQQETNSNKPDFTIFFPDGAKVNVDVKFPFQALQKWQQTEEKEQQKRFLAEFKSDIRNKIREVTSRDYINPQERTLDFVIMFIPNEMIFSFIYEKFPDIWHESITSQVIMCGPFGFTAILRMIQRAYDNFKYQKDLHKIIGHIKAFEIEYTKFSKELDILGKKIHFVSTQYDEVSGVRDRQLTKVIEKIKLSGPVLKKANAENVEILNDTVLPLEKPTVEE